MSSYSVYAERSPRPPFADRNNSSRSSSPARTAVPLSSSDLTQIYDFTAQRTNTDSTYVPDDSLSPSTMLKEAKAPARSATSTSMDSNNSLSHLPRWKVFRLKVLRMATVERLQWLWGALALFGTMAWISLIPALIFRKNLVEESVSDFNASVYNFFMLATIGTSLTAIWQSLCPFLIRQSQTALFPRIINHPATQTATILISVLMTIFNFFSWMVLASDSAGAKTSCAPETKDRISNRPGYPAQCRGVNVAIIFDVIVFLFWIPISLVIVCGTIERGLWWWGEDDGWAQGELAGGNNMMSEEEFDRKIGMGGSKHIHRRQTVHPDALDDQDQESQRPMTRIQRPKPAFVTPIASQFRSQSTLNVSNNSSSNNNNNNNNEDDSDDEIGGFSPSSYRRHQQQRQQRQRQQQQPSQQSGDFTRPSLRRQASNTSLSSRLSSFFGTGWNSGQMPPEEPPMPEMPSQYRNQVNQGNQGNQGGSVSFAAAPPKGQYQPSAKPTTSAMKGGRKEKEEKEAEPEPAGLLHGDSYSSQWHSRWS